MDLDLFIVLPKPATRCPLGAPPIPPAVRSQAEEAMALPSSLLSPAPLCAFLALYPEPAAGSGCASISSAHDPSATFCELSSDGAFGQGGMCVHWSARKSPSAIFSAFFLGATINSQCPVKMRSPRRRCARIPSSLPATHKRLAQYIFARIVYLPMFAVVW